MREADNGSMQLLDVVCEGVSLPPVDGINIESISKLSELILDQTKGELRNNHRLRQRRLGLPSQSGELLMGDLMQTWLTDRSSLPFDCKLPTFILAKILQDQHLDAKVAFYRYGDHQVHPFVVVELENQHLMIGFAVGYDVNRGFYHEPEASVMDVTDDNMEGVNNEYYLFSDLDKAMQFGDLRQEFNIVYCDQNIPRDQKQVLSRELREKINILMAEL